ncbi:MAG: hypothetical protein KF760_13855 [Candidatus Eremiobacteraeota bacterium]|nr:hypothetical protein [Candidatus Eremiobacteraeota bacterium]MCW5871194.1 hypothetical protein [Candidatus Eremiobacteraeota bacterium]
MQSMSSTQSVKVLSHRKSEQRRRQLEGSLLYLIDQDNGPNDKNPMAYDIDLEQRGLSQDGYETVHRIKGRVAGGMLNGRAEFVRSQETPLDEEPMERWSLEYGAEKITCERWRGLEAEDENFYHSLEVISRNPEVDSYMLEWKFSG